MGKDKDKNAKPGKQRPMSMSLEVDASARHPWPEVEAIQQDRLHSQGSTTSASSHSLQKTKSEKRKGGLFSMFRKSSNDLSEWNKNDERLLNAVEHSEVNKVTQLIGKKGVDPTKLDPRGQTAFHRAAEHGHLAIVESMLSYKANPRATDVQGRTPLCCAVHYGRTQVAGRLMQESGTLDAADLRGLTALHHATCGGSADCVRLLISHQCPLDKPDKDGCTALMYASKMGYQSICRELVENGANINARDNTQRTPITYGAENGHGQICEILVKKGAKLHLKDQDGNDAFAWATKGGYKEIQTLFERAPTQAKWNTDPDELQALSVTAEHLPESKLSEYSKKADETTDVTPYEDELQHDKLDLSITPFFSKSDFSSAKVNYDDDSDDFSSAIVPMDEMRQLDEAQNAQSMQSTVNGGINHEQQATSSTNTTSKEAYTELEEEKDMLWAELQRVTLENKHLKASHQPQASIPVENGYDDHEEATQQIHQLEDEVNQLRTHLAEANRRYSVVVSDTVAVKRTGSALRSSADGARGDRSLLNNDSWLDSGDEDSLRESRDEQDKQIAVLRSQVLELTQQNEQLREQSKVLDEVNQNSIPADSAKLAEYKKKIDEDLLSLHRFIEEKKAALSEDEIPDATSDVDIRRMKEDMVFMFERMEDAHEQDHATEVAKMKAQMAEILTSNKQLREEHTTLQEEHEALIEQMCQDEETQQQYHQQIQEETMRLQQEKSELAELMKQVQTSMQQQPQDATAPKQTPIHAPKTNKAASSREGSPLIQERTESSLASLTMEGITLDFLDIVREKDDAQKSVPSAGPSVENSPQGEDSVLTDEKTKLESVLRQIKQERNKLNALEEQLHDSTQTLRTVQLQIEQSNNDFTKHEKERLQLEKEIAKQKSEVDQIAESKERQAVDLESLVQELKQKRDEMSSFANDEQKHKDKLDNEIKEKHNELARMEAHLQMDKDKMEKLNKDYESRTNGLEDLRDVLIELEDDIKQKAREQKELVKENERLAKEMHAMSVSKKKKDKSSEKSDMDNIRKMELTLVKQAPDEDEKSRQLRDMEKEIETLKRSKASLSNEIQVLKRHQEEEDGSLLFKLREENKRLQDENSYLLARENGEVDSIESADGSTDLQRECTILKLENSRLYDDIRTMRKLIDATSGDDKTKVEIDYLREQNEALCSERKQLEMNNTELNNLMETLNDTLQKRGEQDQVDLKHAVLEVIDSRRREIPVEESDSDSEVLNYREELEDLKAINTDQLAIIKQLQRENRHLQHSVDKDESDDEPKDVEEYEAQIVEVTREKEKLSSELASLKIANKNLKEKMRHKDSEHQVTSSEKPDHALTAKYQQSQEELEDVREQLSHIQEENEQFLETIKDLQTQVEERKNTDDAVQSLNEDNDVLVKEIRDLQNEMEKVSKKKIESDGNMDEMTKKLSALQMQNKELEEENKELLREQLKLHVERSVNKDHGDDKGDREVTDERVTQIVGLKKAMEELEAKNKELVVQLNETTIKAEASSETHTSAHRPDEEEHNAELVAQIEELQDRLEAIGAEHEADLVEEQERSQQEIDRVVEVSKDLSKELEQYKDLIEDLKEDNEAKVQDLMEEQDFLLEKIKALESSQASKEHKYEHEDPLNEKDEIIQELETQVEELKEKLERTQREIESLKEVHEKHKQDEASAKQTAQSIIEAEKKLEQLQSENDALKLQVLELQRRLEVTSRTPSPRKDEGENEQIQELQRTVARLQEEIDKVNRYHKDTVNTYRTHLLAAAEGRMDPEVRQALMHIITLRTPDSLRPQKSVSSC